MTPLTPVAEALARILGSVASALPAEEVPIGACHGRTLADDLVAARTQPPFPASAMDGYALRAADWTSRASVLRLVGASLAGHGFPGRLGPGEAVRIFTGAPLPEGADAVVIQENVERHADEVRLAAAPGAGRHIRPAGTDFNEGEILLRAGQRLDARRLALAAAMGHPALPARRKPRVAILATGDELVRPGEPAGRDQIVASNTYAVAAMAARAGAESLDLGIAADRIEALTAAVDQAREAQADVLVTLGGASVGDHDLVRQALAGAGMDLSFWRIAMRPGKPFMFGRLGAMSFLGLPGNPVSAIVCAILFLVPLVRALLGDPGAGQEPSQPARLGGDLAANDERQDYLRATLAGDGEDWPTAIPLLRQDSSLLSALSEADGLIVRPPHAPAAQTGNRCRVIPLARFV